MSPSAHLAKTNNFCWKNHTRQHTSCLAAGRPGVAAGCRTQETVRSISQHPRTSSEGKDNLIKGKNKCAVRDPQYTTQPRIQGEFTAAPLALGPLPLWKQQSRSWSWSQPYDHNQRLFISTKYSNCSLAEPRHWPERAPGQTATQLWGREQTPHLCRSAHPLWPRLMPAIPSIPDLRCPSHENHL